MSDRTVIITDASVDISSRNVRESLLLVSPRRFLIGGQVETANGKRPISAYLSGISRRNRKLACLLPADSTQFLSAYQAVGKRGMSAFVILPPESVDSSFEMATIARGLIKDEVTVSVPRIQTTAGGILFLAKQTADFSRRTASSLDAVNAFFTRLHSEVRCIVIVKDHLNLEVYPQPRGIKRFLTKLFGRQLWVNFSPQGNLRESGNESLGRLSSGQRLLVEYSTQAHNLAQQIGQKMEAGHGNVSVKPLAVLPERLSELKRIIVLNVLPSPRLVKKIGQWAHHWEKRSKTKP